MHPFTRRRIASGNSITAAGMDRPSLLVWACLVAVSVFVPGCDPKPPARLPNRLPALSALDTDPGHAIVAQGQLKPAGGILPITAPPGDRVESIAVKVGSQVEADQILGRLASQRADEIELEIAQTRLREGRQKLAAEQEVARARLEVANVDLEQAQLRVQQATQQLERAEAEGGRFDLLQQRVRIAQDRLQQLREAAADPTAGRLVTERSIEEQQLQVDEALDDLENARREAEAGIEAGELAVESARREIRAAELAIESAEAGASLDSLQKQIELLELKLDATQLKSPIEGTVLSIDIGEGEPTTGRPIMQLANTSQIVCRAEVNVAELPRLSLGAQASVSSPAIDGVLYGTVDAISPLIGSPSLPDPNPMARVDWRSVEVTIRIQDKDVSKGRHLINLQVDVAIEARKSGPREDEPQSPPPEQA